jgi:hypothetical protein
MYPFFTFWRIDREEKSSIQFHTRDLHRFTEHHTLKNIENGGELAEIQCFFTMVIFHLVNTNVFFSMSTIPTMKDFGAAHSALSRIAPGFTGVRRFKLIIFGW